MDGTPAVIYAAKSTQDKNQSIPKQKEDGRKKAAEEGWIVIDDFEDENFSAYSGNRGPGLKDATNLATSVAAEWGTTCMLVAQHSDRFARGAGDAPGAADSLGEIWSRLRRKDVHLRSFQNDTMLSKPVLVAVASEQAFEESNRKSMAVRDGIERRVRKGLVSGGGRRRYGYRWANDGTKMIIPVPVEAQVIYNRIYVATLAGESQPQIMRDLEADGIPTSTGARWHAGTISQILKNPLYKGIVIVDGEEIEGLHEAIVDVDLWEAVADLRRSRKPRGKGRGRRTSGKHVFRKGLLECVCGESLVPRTHRRKGVAYEYYGCYGQTRDPNCACHVAPLRRDVVDRSIYRYFERVGVDVEATRRQVAEVAERDLAEIQALLDQAQTQERKTEEKIVRVRRDYADGEITATEWHGFRDEFEAQLEAAHAEADRLSDRLVTLETERDGDDIEIRALQRLAAIRAAIAGEVKDANSIDAIRVATERLFTGFKLIEPKPGERIDLDLAWQGPDRAFAFEPQIREEALLGKDGGQPIFRREPLWEVAENNFNVGVVT